MLLLEYAGASRLLKDKFSGGGSIKSPREQLVRQYIATIPRHFSHYSPTSTSEYVACASSCLNWWKGPLEVDQDGTHPLCFLQWLDKRNDTNDYHIYLTHDYFPGVNRPSVSRPLPVTIEPACMPVPAVSCNYFNNIV